MKPREASVSEAKTKLSRLIREVEQGHTFYITKRGKRVAELGPAAPVQRLLTRGCAKTAGFWMARDFAETPADFANYV